MKVLNSNIIVENFVVARKATENGIITLGVVDLGYSVGVIYAGNSKAMEGNGLAVGDMVYYPIGGGIEEFDYDGKDLTVLHVNAIMGKKEGVDNEEN